TGTAGRCFIAAGTQSFLWIEGDLVGKPPSGSDARVLVLSGVRFSQARHVHGHGTDGNGFYLRRSEHNTFYDIQMMDCDSTCLVLSEASFSHFEGFVSINGGSFGMSLSDSNNNRFEDVYIEGSNEDGIYFSSGTGNVFFNLGIVGARTDSGMTLYGVGNAFYNVVAVDNDGSGIRVIHADNVFVNVIAANNRYDGVQLRCLSCDPERNTLVNVIASNNASNGVSLASYDDAGTMRRTRANTVSHVTAINNGSDGVDNHGGRLDVINQVLAVNNAEVGLKIGNAGAGDNLASQIASGSNGEWNVQLWYADRTVFTGYLLVSEPADNCSVEGGTDPGLFDLKCSQDGTDRSFDYGDFPSDAVLRINVDLAEVLRGKVSSDDIVNQSDDNGTGVQSMITDWSGFESAYRFWGVDGSTFPTDTNRGRCVGDTCRIWDVALSATDIQLYNISGIFIADAPCPVSASGDEALTDYQTPPNTFLANATELVLDGAGDDDGLCESNEACLYSPHIGAYQGAGDTATRTCVFQNGAVSNVTLYGY
ncbi:right-handed parallel beta-helix repeat-containing protein, partial [Myxococcota bacterium]